MSQEAIKAAKSKFAEIAASVRAAGAADNPQAIADTGKAIADVRSAQAEHDAENSTAPATMNETVTKAIDDQRRELAEAAIAMQALAQDNAAVRSQLAELRRKQSEVEAKADKFRFNVDGSVRGEFDRDMHQRIMETRTTDPRIREMQTVHDALCIMGAVQDRAASRYRSMNDPEMFPFTDKQTGKRIATMAGLRTKQKYDAMVRAMYSTGAGVGDEFVPTMVSAIPYEHYEHARGVAAHFERIMMPSNPWIIPAEITDPTWYIAGEAKADPGVSAASSEMGTASRTLTAVTLAALVRMSEELNEDSVVAVTPLLQKRLGTSWATTEEDAFINGDTTSTHQDAGLTLAANSHLRAWDGLRDAVQNGAKTDLGTFTDATFLGHLAKMGAHGIGTGPNRPLFITSVRTFLKYILTSSFYFSVEKLASSIALANPQGVNGMYYHGLVVVSDKMRDDLNVSGVYDGSTMTTGSVLVVNPQAWVIGERKGMTLRMVEDVEAGQQVMVARVREIPKKLEGATVLSEGLGYNIT